MPCGHDGQVDRRRQSVEVNPTAFASGLGTAQPAKPDVVQESVDLDLVHRDVVALRRSPSSSGKERRSTPEVGGAHRLPVVAPSSGATTGRRERPAVRSPIRSCTCHPSRCSSRPRRRTPRRRPPDRRSRRHLRCMPRGRGSPSRSARGTPACTGRLPPCRTRSCTRRRVPRSRVTVHRGRRRSRRPRHCMPPPAACTGPATQDEEHVVVPALPQVVTQDALAARRRRSRRHGAVSQSSSAPLHVSAAGERVLGRRQVRRADPCSWRPASRRHTEERRPLRNRTSRRPPRRNRRPRRCIPPPAVRRSSSRTCGVPCRGAATCRKSGLLALAVLDAELRFPSPQRAAGQEPVQASPSSALPSSHASTPIVLTPSPQRAARQGPVRSVAAVGGCRRRTLPPRCAGPVPAPRQAAVRTALVTVERIAVVALLPGLGLQRRPRIAAPGGASAWPAGPVEADLSRPAGDARRQTETAEVYGHVDRAARRERRPDTPLHSHAPSAARPVTRNSTHHDASPAGWPYRGGAARTSRAQDDGLDRLRVVVGITVSRARRSGSRRAPPERRIRRHGQADGRGRRRSNPRGPAGQGSPGWPGRRPAVPPASRSPRFVGPIPMRPGPAGTPSGSRTQSRRAHLEVGRLTDRSNRHGRIYYHPHDGGQQARATNPPRGACAAVAGRKPPTSSKGQAPAQGSGRIEPGAQNGTPGPAPTKLRPPGNRRVPAGRGGGEGRGASRGGAQVRQERRFVPAAAAVTSRRGMRRRGSRGPSDHHAHGGGVGSRRGGIRSAPSACSSRRTRGAWAAPTRGTGRL